MTDRTQIHTDGTFNDQTGVGGWAAIVVRSNAGRQEGTSSYEMELRALVEAVKMAVGPCTIVSDHEGIIGLAREGRTPRMCRAVWEELYAATSGKDVEFVWKKRDRSLGQRLAHQLARDAAKGRGRNGTNLAVTRPEASSRVSVGIYMAGRVRRTTSEAGPITEIARTLVDARTGQKLLSPKHGGRAGHFLVAADREIVRKWG